MKKLCLVIILIIQLIGCASHGEYVSLSPLEFDRQIDNLGHVQIIDLRSDSEFWEGRIANAEHFSYTDDAIVRLTEGLDPSIAIFLYCDLGGVSQEVANSLSEAGFTDIYVLEGGIDNWRRAGLPLVQ